MQTTDASTLLNILQSPMGAALLPTLANRESMVMDQSRATLADTLARTGIAQDENKRANEMQPGRVKGLDLENISKNLSNQDLKFKGQVRDSLGVDFAVKQEQNKATVDDLKIAEAGHKNFSTIAAMVSQAPDAPGARRQIATQLIQQYRLPPAMADVVSKMEEGQIGPAFEQMARKAAEFTRQAYVADSTNASRERMADKKNLTSVQVAEIRAKAQRDVAQIMAEAKRRAGGDSKQEKLNMEQLYSRLRQQEMSASTEEEKEYYAHAARRVYDDIQGKPAGAGAVGTGLIPPTQPGRGPTLGPVPKVQPRPSEPMPPRPAGLPASQNPTAPTVANAQRKAAAQSSGNTRYKFNPQTGKIELQ